MPFIEFFLRAENAGADDAVFARFDDFVDEQKRRTVRDGLQNFFGHTEAEC